MKTKKLILFLIISFFVTTFSKAQLIYIDIIPDTTISSVGGYYNLDLNCDGIYDFKITRSLYAGNNSVDILILHDSSFVSTYNLDGCTYSTAYLINDSIGNASPWIYQNYEINIANYGGGTFCMHYGAFLGHLNNCLGLKIIKNGIVYFGWVRIDVASDATWFKMKDFAYNNAKIYAGLTSTNIDKIKKNNDRFNIIDNTTEIVIRPIKINRIITAKLYNQISQEINNFTKNIEEITILKSQYKSGLYFLKIETNDGIYTLKLVVQ